MEWRSARGRAGRGGARAAAGRAPPPFSRGEVVFHRDDPGDSLHLIVKGRFAIRVMTPLGDTATIAVRGPGESFGEMALVDEEAPVGDSGGARVGRDDAVYDRLRRVRRRTSVNQA